MVVEFGGLLCWAVLCTVRVNAHQLAESQSSLSCPVRVDGHQLLVPQHPPFAQQWKHCGLELSGTGVTVCCNDSAVTFATLAVVFELLHGIGARMVVEQRFRLHFGLCLVSAVDHLANECFKGWRHVVLGFLIAATRQTTTPGLLQLGGSTVHRSGGQR